VNDTQAFRDWLQVELQHCTAAVSEQPPNFDRVSAAIDAMRDIHAALRLLDLYQATEGA
jgi:hypothetical protein